MSSSPLTSLSISETRQLLMSKQVSCVELTQAYINKIESVDSTLGALITFVPDIALDQAKLADKEISDCFIAPFAHSDL